MGLFSTKLRIAWIQTARFTLENYRWINNLITVVSCVKLPEVRLKSEGMMVVFVHNLCDPGPFCLPGAGHTKTGKGEE